MRDEQSNEDMGNIKVALFVESRYKVNRKRIASTVSNLLQKQEIVGPVEVSIAVVGDRKMRELNKKYRDKDGTTNVLSFPLSEGESMTMPTDVLRLGDIVISYPKIIQEASEDDVLVDDKIDELVNHGLMHLMGIHHDE